MSESRDRKVSRLFEEALDLAGDERSRFLREECAGDTALFREVSDLLDQGEPAARLLAPPRFLDESAGGPRPEALPRAELPAKIGPYRILGIIAEGGMGTVYLAEQEEPIRRQVALKLVKLGMDTKRVVARFEMERQTLALMDHPHIARVFDAGSTPEGRPYFVMEYFPGHALTRFADEENLGIEERLRLFLQACEAVQSAHQKGVIHRDLKPSNLLVLRVEGKPFLKVIDFGIAKVVEEDVPGLTRFTVHGEVIGTPEYMSPEQAGLRPEGIDTTTDVYSLGVLLYQLLTGALPVDRPTAGGTGPPPGPLPAVTPDPVRPSDRLVHGHPSPEQAAQARRTSVTHLRRVLRQDLDWIVLKAIDGDRSHRYQSVADLADDIQRHLEGSTVRAAAPTTVYRFRKLFHRHRTPVLAAAAVLLALLAGTVAATRFAIQAERERALQAEATKKAEEQARLARENGDLAERNAYGGSLVAAEAALRDGDMVAVAKYLQRAPEKLRGWEWRYLHGRIDQSRGVFTLPRGFHMRQQPGVLAILPGGGRVATVAQGESETRYLEWDLASGAVVRQRSFAAEPAGACLSPGGEWLVRISEGRCLVERAATGEDSRTLPAPMPLDYLVPVALTQGGRHFCLVGYHSPGNSSVRHWVVDARSGRFVPLAQRGGLPAISEASGRVAQPLHEDLDVLNLATGASESIRRFSDTDLVTCAWDRRAPRVYAVDLLGTTFAWEPGRSRPSWIAPALRPGALWTVAQAGNGEILVSGRIHEIRFLDPITGGDRGVLHGHQDEVWEIRTDPHRNAAVSRTENEIRSWDLGMRHAVPEVLIGHTSFVYPVAFDRTGSRVASGGFDGRLIVWDTASGRPERVLRFRESEITALAYLPAMDRFVGVVGCKTLGSMLVGVDPVSGAVDSLRIPSRRSNAAVAADPVRPRIALVWFEYMRPKGLTIWDFDTGKILHEMTVDRPMSEDSNFAVGYRPDGSQLAVTLDAPEILILDGETFAETHRLDLGEGRVSQLAYSPDGRRLAAACDDRIIRIWDTDTWELSGQMIGHTGILYGLAWSPDGRRLFSGGDDGLVRVWDPVNDDELLQLRGHRKYVHSVAMSPDGTTLASGSGDGTVRLWRASTN